MKRIAAVLTAVCLLFALTACGRSKDQGIAVSGEKVDVGDIALRPDGEVGHIYENEGLRLMIPLEYDQFLLTETPEKDAEGVLFSVSEKESLAAANNEPGAGWIFGICRIDEAAMREMICYDMSGRELFAKDAEGNYYIYSHPTDVRLYRENNEAMTRDMELWAQYNEWAWNDVRSSFLAENTGLTAVTYGNSALEMCLARMAYKGDVEYTVSTTQYGPLVPEFNFICSFKCFC